jgi:hypothetical protein
MRNTLPILLLVFMLLSVACLGEDAKKAEMALDTKVDLIQVTFPARYTSHIQSWISALES